MNQHDRLREISDKTGKVLINPQINIHTSPDVPGQKERSFCSVSVYCAVENVTIKANGETPNECFDNIEALLTPKKDNSRLFYIFVYVVNGITIGMGLVALMNYLKN